MKKLLLFSISFFLFGTAYSQESLNYSKTELIVKFKTSYISALKSKSVDRLFDNDILHSIHLDHKVRDIKMTGNRKHADTYVVEFAKEEDIEQLIDIYSATGLFDYVEPNFIGKGTGVCAPVLDIPNDTYFNRQWGLYNDGFFSLSEAKVDADIDMELAWDIEQGKPKIKVAILDSGAKLDHPEFEGRNWENVLETIDGIDNDNNGYIDDINGWDFAYSDKDAWDDHGHGSNVAGIVGANGNNNLGYAGVDRNCKLMHLKILNEENLGFYTWWADAIYYAVDHGASVLNMSVAGVGYSNLLETAVNYAYNNGVIIVAAMMNLDNNVTYYPAGFTNTIAVGSTDANDERSSPFFWDSTSGSNYGNHIDVVAPGNYIYGLHHQSNFNFNSYWGGTSQSAPLVAGLCALLLAQDSDRTPDEVRSILRSTAEDQVGNPTEDIPGFDQYHGYGRINAYAALSQPITSNENIVIEDFITTLYPNPASKELNIESEHKIGSITITDIHGKEVFNKLLDTGTSSLKVDIGAIPNGMYIVSLYYKDLNKFHSRKIVVE